MLERRAGVLRLYDWLVAQANLRGFHGAFSRIELPDIDAELSLEELVVGLCQPHTPADGRLFKLVLRLLQSPDIDPARLAFLARRERAGHVLRWLLDRVPPEENTPSVTACSEAIGAPRGYRPPVYVYDARRLTRRPFRAGEAAWTRRRGSS